MNRFVIIEDFYPFPQLVVDFSGKTIVFERKEDAASECKKCQNGIIVQL